MEPSSAAQTKRNDNDLRFGLYLPFIQPSPDVAIFKQSRNMLGLQAEEEYAWTEPAIDYRGFIENDLNKGEIGVAVAGRKP